MITVLLVSVATALIVICCVGTCACAWTWSRYVARRRVHARLSQATHGHACCGPERLGKSGETHVELLQRRFVSGEISLDQYERDIDRLHRHPTPA